MEDKEVFKFTYSAKEQEEIKAIRKKYSPTDEVEDKVARLKRLDASVAQKAQAASLVFGVIGALILGFGMSLIMTNLGDIFGAYAFLSMPIGIITGVIGIVLVCLAYPIYNKVLKKEREKIAPEIIRLTDELIKF